MSERNAYSAALSSSCHSLQLSTVSILHLSFHSLSQQAYTVHILKRWFPNVFLSRPTLEVEKIHAPKHVKLPHFHQPVTIVVKLVTNVWHHIVDLTGV